MVSRSIIDSPSHVVDALTRSDVTGFAPTTTAQLLQGLCFRRVRGARAVWGDSQEETRTYLQSWVDTLTALAGRGHPLALLLSRNHEEVEMHMGTVEGAMAELLLHLPLALASPAATAEEWEEQVVCSIGIGVPLSALPDEGPMPDVAGRLLRALVAVPDGFAGVVARPVHRREVERELARLRAALASFRASHHAEVLRRDPAAEAADESLKRAISLHEEALAVGAWESIFFAGGEDGAGDVVASIAAGALSDSETSEPFRFLPCHSGGQPLEATLLPSPRLASMLSMPRAEVTGYRVFPAAQFSVDPAEPREPRLSIGRVIGLGSLGGEAGVPLHSLTRHTMVAGQSGAGKTNTIMHLLGQLWRRQSVPFLVVEPVKGEYRTMKGTAGLEGLRVHSVGRAGGPRLNPLAFDPQQVDLHTHVSYLMAVFNASLGLIPPLPQVLERAVYQAYGAKGWNAATGRSKRGLGKRAFPTLGHLYEAIDPTVRDLGYETRVSQDISGALKARVGSMRLGARGRCFDGEDSFDIGAMLKEPAVLELTALADNEQIAMAMGLIVVRLSQHLAAQGLQTGETTLRHVTVLEEAHRLLAAEQRPTSYEGGSVRGRAVEMLSDLIAEVRAYGEGIVIVDQIPSRLDESALKNTDLKIMHRLPGADDRESMGRAMGMSDEQQNAAVFLSTGEAVVFAQGFHGPSLVQVPPAKRAFGNGPEGGNQRLLAEADGEALGETQFWLPRDLRAAGIRLITDLAFGDEEHPSRPSQAGVTLPAGAADAVRLANAVAEWISLMYDFPVTEEEALADDLRTGLGSRSREPIASALARLRGAAGAFAGCSVCASPCRYRWLLPESLDVRLTAILRQPGLWVGESGQHEEECVQAVFAVVEALGVRVRERADVALCVLAHALSGAGATEKAQAEFAGRLGPHLEARGNGDE
jgi:DNA helicase HerA-like ATPase